MWLVFQHQNDQHYMNPTIDCKYINIEYSLVHWYSQLMFQHQQNEQRGRHQKYNGPAALFAKMLRSQQLSAMLLGGPVAVPTMPQEHGPILEVLEKVGIFKAFKEG